MTATRSVLRVALILLGASLAVRLLFLLPVVAHGMPAVADEEGYLRRAAAFRSIALDAARLETPAGEDLEAAYGKGAWPPVHPLLLSLGLLVFGEGAAGARLVVVLVGALTTPLVFLLALRHTTRKGALIAAGIHVVYPSFVAFSHFLWSETTFVFLLLATAACAMRLPRSAPGRGLVAQAAVTGVLLGLCVLTRASALPFLIAVPAWLAWTSAGTRGRVLLPALVLGASVLTVLPWELKLARETGRFVPFSTLAGYNLALGNNPWIRAGLGSSWGRPGEMHYLERRIHQRAVQEDCDAEQAAVALAIQVARGDPRAAVVRSLERLRMLWTVDFFVVRHALHAAYPPMPPAAVGWLALVTGASLVALVGLAAWGFLVGPPLAGRSLLFVLLLAGTAPVLATIGMPRLNLPQLALLLPAAGHGALHLRRGAASPARVAACAAVLALLSASIATSLRLVSTHHLHASSLYSDLLGRTDRLLRSTTPLADHLVFRATGAAAEGPIRIEVLSANAASAEHAPGARLWRPAVDGRWFEMNATSVAGAGPLKIRVASERLGSSVVLEPVHPGAWRVWKDTGVAGIDVFWSGGKKDLAQGAERSARASIGGDPARSREPADRTPADRGPAALAALGYVEFAPAADGEAASGVVLIDHTRSCPGYNLLASIPDARVTLMDAGGRVVRDWTFDDADWVVRCRILANGDLLVINRIVADDSSYVARLTFAGEELWRATGLPHHDAIETPDGNLLVLGARFREPPNARPGRGTFLDNTLISLSPAGELLQELSLYDLLREHGAPFRRRPVPRNDVHPDWSDPFHCNSLQWLDDASLAGRHPLYARGNVLLSLRNQNVLLILDRDARKPIWAWGEDELLGQHEASLLGDGTILLFDNGGPDRPYSRILRVDPVEREIVWSWQAGPPETFYSAARGTVQALANGNHLVAHSEAGEAFELTPEGEIVWRFLNPSQDAEGRRATLRVHRYDETFVDALLEREDR